MVALDPEQTACFIADGDDHTGLAGPTRQQQPAHHVHDPRQRMRATMLFKDGISEIERWQGFDPDELRHRPSPRITNERTHICQTRIHDVSRDELLVRALDHQS
ncbi:hypothetical protein GCM10017596_06370 [Microbacterium keratanolyticum]|uniref:Uncharacterized protein n=1 Tax=Microbacterium keratanolyticum TaxID=67574 RepID=A0A9W6M7Y0_9MICO|nr:hypothetical protein GCM10017596_06370 [Microbacterium keratanolyticum]